MSVVRDLMRLTPISVGTEAPPLSLTADQGTWVKLRDFKGQMAVVLLFFKSEDNDTEAWLRAWSDAKDTQSSSTPSSSGSTPPQPSDCETCAHTCAAASSSSTTLWR